MSRKKRKFKLPIKAYLLYLILVSFMLTGVTFSKHITKSNCNDKARVAKFGNLSITENGKEYDKDVFWNIVPGVDISKNAVIEFENGETACYLFYEIETSGFTKAENEYKTKNDWLKFKLAETSSADEFSGLKISDNKTVYYTVLNPGEKIKKAVFADGGKITVSSNLTAGDINSIKDDLSINIKVSAVQYGGFDSPKDAYLSIN